MSGSEITGSGVLDVFTLDEIADHVWRSRTTDPRGGRMFGGTMIAQTISAARLSVAAPTHTSGVSIHFLRPADGGAPCDYRVERPLDGKSSAVRTVTAVQDGHTVAIATVTFRAPRDTWTHGQRGAPPVHPDTLPPTGMPHRARAIPPGAFDIRYYDDREDGIFVRRLWFRAIDVLPGAPIIHECVAAMISDLYFFEPIVAEQGLWANDPTIRYATTQHAMWFHHAPRADDWLLIESRSPVAAGGRGLVSGEIRTAGGLVVATVVQEVVIQMITDARSSSPGRGEP